VRPQTLDEALVCLDDNPEAVVLAGGQSLMPLLNFRMSRPAMLVDINRIPALDRIEVAADALQIGARARHNDVLRSPEVGHSAPLLVAALPHVAHEAIRNRGTFGGSMAMADPAAELPACAVCLDAEIVTASKRGGERRIAAAAFFNGIYATALAPGEMIVRVDVPSRDGVWRFAFEEIARRRGDFAMAGLALAVRLEACTIRESRIVMCGVEAAPRRVAPAEAALDGYDIGDAAAARGAGDALVDALDPIDSAELPDRYRRHLSRVLLERALRKLAEGSS
jgi:carbon-monoxide dehydrogenase medium subunit